MRLTKLANWFSDGDLEKYQQQAEHAQQAEAQLSKMKSKVDKLNHDYEKSQKELAQTKAQLQINRGFQIELGETQLKLQQAQAMVQRYKQELFEQQKELSQKQLQFQQTQQTLAKLSQSQDWINQIKTPIQIVDIKKTLPKRDFETLWGFGILTPTVDSVIDTGAMLVKGWVLGKKATAQTVKVTYQTETILQTPVELRRPIVIQQYPDIPNANQSGFEFALAVAGITKEIELSLEAILSDQTVVSLCNFVLKPQTIESNDT
ncbi:MAG: hypothetical protein AAGE84_04330 [Cyanobacteria bacterium P01_G01_bin.39]